MKSTLKNNPYVKAELTPELNKALEIVSKKLGNSKASIVSIALEYYFKKEWSEILPKTEEEMLQIIKQNHDYQKFKTQYEQEQTIKENITKTKNDLKKTLSDLEKIEKEIEGVESKLNIHTKMNKEITPIQKKLSELKERKKELENEKSVFENILKYT